jgi:hypothetical protein
MRTLAVVALAAALALVGGCAAQPSPAGSEDWGKVCYPGFDTEVERAAGSRAVDCGFYNRPEKALQTAAWACMRHAIEQGRTFKVGYLSSGDDSQYCHAALRTPDKRIVEIYYDFDVTGGNGTDGGNSSMQIMACDRIFDEPSLIGEGSFFKLDACGPVSDHVREIFHDTETER